MQKLKVVSSGDDRPDSIPGHRWSIKGMLEDAPIVSTLIHWISDFFTDYSYKRSRNEYRIQIPHDRKILYFYLFPKSSLHIDIEKKWWSS